MAYVMHGRITVLNTTSISSKDGYLGPQLVLDVLVDGEDEQEDKEEAGAAKKVPDVVPEKKVSSERRRHICPFVAVAQVVFTLSVKWTGWWLGVKAHQAMPRYIL